MNARREFLAALFRILERDSVPYCILRNYENIYEDASSDIDVAVEPKHVRRFRQALNDAAEFSGFSLIHQTRYINFSYVYWSPAGIFLRVDVETEVRWRIFPVLSAGAVVGLRRKHGEFYIPHPRHESVVIFLAALWRRTVRERYQDQLAALYEQIQNPEELRRTFRAAFGKAGDAMVECQSRIRECLPSPELWRQARKAIMRNALATSPNRRALLAYVGIDFHRFCERLRNPPGISLLYVSRANPAETEELFKRLEFLYPTQKSTRHTFEVAQNERSAMRMGWRLQCRRLYTLFKGGLFMRYYQVAEDSEVPKIVGTLSRHLYPSRAFYCAQNSKGETSLGHGKTGLTTRFNVADSGTSPHDRIIQFITAILSQQGTQKEASAAERGLVPSTNPKDRSTRRFFLSFMRTIISIPRLALAGLILLLIAAPGFFTIGYLKKQARAITEDTLPGLSFAGAANANLAQAFNRTLMLLLCDDLQERAKLSKEIEDFSQKTTAYLESYRRSIFTHEDRTQFNILLDQRAQYLRIREKTVALADANKRSEAIALYNSELLPAYQRYKEAGDKLFCYNAKQGQSRAHAIITGFTITEFLIGGTGMVLFILGFVFGTSRPRADYAVGEYA